jgi:hypothetical protein
LRNPLDSRSKAVEISCIRAFLRKRRVGKATYHYILRSERRAGKVVQKCLEYLGKSPDPKRLKRALRYWGVKGESGNRGGKER